MSATLPNYSPSNPRRHSGRAAVVPGPKRFVLVLITSILLAACSTKIDPGGYYIVEPYDIPGRQMLSGERRG